LDRRLYSWAAIAGFLGIALGAFGAHALKSNLSPERMAVIETGIRYQMYHVFALALTAWGWSRWPRRIFVVAGILFGTGIALFCGSLYLLGLTGTRAWGAVTPFGGLAFLAGWLCLAWGARSRLEA
jgi:uncharacterized membrane protein YgdD (TMEM256/DUF423 family)